MWTLAIILFLDAFILSIIAAKTTGRLSLICTLLMIVFALGGGYVAWWEFDHQLVEIGNAQE